ncbi:MAG: hypothetical protein B7W98_03270 [Parcubacteria group bacterium 20-58-5]|nr:MAG: hypothetical protein B7W98_03270 [Parcubacteria group bacterium 20-58-5]
MKIKPLTIIRIGLAFAFLANSLTAFISPQDFLDLINPSFLSVILPFNATLLVILIGVNDALVAILLFSGGKRARVIEWWAIIWLIGVLAVKVTGGSYLDALEEVAFVAMGLALVMQGRFVDA